MATRILLTGASGFVGRHTLKALIEAGAEVHAVGREAVPPGSIGAAPVRWHRADLLDAGARHGLINEIQPDTIVHFAWGTEHGRFWTAPANLDWVAATLDMVHQAQQSGMTRFVGLGTCFEYAWQTTEDCSERDTPLDPTTLYGIAKDAARRVIEGFARQESLSWAWGRLFLLYGPEETPSRLVPQVAGRLIQGEPAPIGTGERPRDFMDARDAGAAVAALALSRVEGPINIASGEASSVRAVAETLGSLAGTPDLIRVGALADRDEPERLVARTDRLRGEVGFTAIRPLEQGLSEALDWWRDKLNAEAEQR